MNEFDELHHMMERAAADPPDLADRADVVRTRGRRLRRRRRVIGAAAAVAVIGGGTAVVLPLLPSGGNASQRVTVVSTPSDTPSPTDSPTDTPTSAPATPSPVVSTALPTPTPTPTPTADSPSPSPSDSPAPQQTEALSYSVATHLAPANGNGYAMTVVAIHVTGWVSGDVTDSELNIDPNETLGYVQGPHERCTTSATIHSIDQTFTYTYAFREATSYPIHFWFWAGTCRNSVGHDWRTTIGVTQGNSQTNGPTEPAFYQPFYNASASGGAITIRPSFGDADGNVSQLSVDWGNGGPPTVINIQQSCNDPAPSGKYWPDSATSQTATSPTLSPGTYTVTITVTSTGCDGNYPQTASTSHTFTVTG